MPVYDENYFYKNVSEYFTWKDRVYAVNAWQGVDAIGVHYNKSLFENAGETTPGEYFENGNWTFQTFLAAAKAMHNVEGGANDVYGVSTTFDNLFPAAIVANGADIVKRTSDSAILEVNSDASMEAINWASNIRSYITESDCLNVFKAGQAAMFLERYNSARGIMESSPDYEFGWVPFPVGPSGETVDGVATQTGLCYGWAIGKGSKNIEGAMAWIGADCYRNEYFAENGIEIKFGPDEWRDTTLEIYKKAEKNGKTTLAWGIGVSIYQMVEDSKGMGVAAAIEKHTPQWQAKIDEFLGKEVIAGAIDFEDQGVIDFESADRYPFVNVIGDDKMTYGTAEITSLNVDLSGMTDFGAILHTKPEMYKLQTGGQYKVTFKLYVDAELDNETLALAAKTTDALDGDAIAMNWIENIKVGDTTEVEAYFNINSAFTGDLAIVLMGSATDANPDLKLIIDDFRVELVSGQ